VASFRSGVVVEMLVERPGLQRVLVRIEGEDQRAYNVVQLTGQVAVGDEVVCNTTAVGLSLGTGGWHIVHWNLSHRSLDTPSGGHIMKLRYTSLQVDTGAVVERGEWNPGSQLVPVVVCSLHSQVAVVAAMFASAAPGKRLAYVMTDGGALPIVMSELVHELRSKGLLSGTVTTGHAFGGDIEAVNVTSGLLGAAHDLSADAIVVGMGPGVVGTGSTYGTTALEVAAILDDVAHLGRQPILCVRASQADLRLRHRGISHHSITALHRRMAAVCIAVPKPDVALLDDVTYPTQPADTIAIVDVPDVGLVLESHGLQVTTMGRGPHEDAVFFRFSAAAAVVAAQQVAAQEVVGRQVATQR
jgi:hypothetical protein